MYCFNVCDSRCHVCSSITSGKRLLLSTSSSDPWPSTTGNYLPNNSHSSSSVFFFFSKICILNLFAFFLQGFLLILICPLNIFYKSSRYRLISVIRNIVFSPLYKVVMLDFFMADQLCSQVIP